MEAELNGQVPQDSTLAYAAFMSNMSKTILMEMLPEDAIETAFAYSQTATETRNTATERNQSDSTPNLVSEPLEKDWPTLIYDLFKTTFPEHVGPELSLCEQLQEACGRNWSLLNNVVTMLDASTTPIQTPPVLALWLLKNRDHRFINESAEIIRNKSDDTTHIQKALRESERKMREAEKPAVTPDHIARLEELKARLRG